MGPVNLALLEMQQISARQSPYQHARTRRGQAICSNPSLSSGAIAGPQQVVNQLRNANQEAEGIRQTVAPPFTRREDQPAHWGAMDDEEAQRRAFGHIRFPRHTQQRNNPYQDAWIMRANLVGPQIVNPQRGVIEDYHLGNEIRNANKADEHLRRTILGELAREDEDEDKEQSTRQWT
ncbi:MAG: hypothetical protein M1827_000485 [Pycnora praestabilis]|nr:MAG: hypothetical protein M1827_000485 [Pycnora praestabilis]